MTSTVNIDQLPKNMQPKIRMDLCDVPGLHPFCWTWKPARASRRGYGAIWHQGLTRPTHRVVYELLIGPVRPGLHLDHLCRHTACCNPEHLEPVTIQVNVQRGLAAKIDAYVKSLGPASGVSLMAETDHIKSGEARLILRVNGTTLSRWASEGVIPSVKLPGRNGAFVYKRTDVERFADARAAAQQENAS